MKIAFVVQRCGNDIRGGAESVCLNLAKKLLPNFEIEILTTCAKDYMSWKNHYKSGIEITENISIRRFKVDSERELEKFNKISEKIYFQKHSTDEENQWMKLQGPYSTQMIDFVKENHNQYDLFIFFTYLYATTYYILPIVSEKSILIPFAHDEPPLKLSIYEKIFQSPLGIIFSTEEEKQLVLKQFSKISDNTKIIGVGVDPPSEIPQNFSKLKLDFQYIAYIGRIDESKGCKELINYFLNYVKENNFSLKLVLAGPKILEFEKNPNIVYLGEVDEIEKSYILKNCVSFIMPSKYESFSIAIMEAWFSKKPIIVNEKSSVLKGHCEKSNGGFYYGNYEEFKKTLDQILNNVELQKNMGENGHFYVKNIYGWNKIIQDYGDFLNSICNENHYFEKKPNNLKEQIVTFVIPWYGENLTGGAESLCRKTAEHLESHGVKTEVFTTCSKQFYSDWKNDYTPGNYVVNKIPVTRFSVDLRDIVLFDSINYKLINKIPISEEEELQFFQNNINSSSMMSQIKKEKDKRIYLFIPYLYGTTFFGAQITPAKSILIPCLHDEIYAYMKIFKKIFQNSSGIIFNSKPEKLLAESIYEKLPVNQVLGTGVEIQSGNPQHFKEKFHLDKFLLYTGRKDPQKNINTLVDYYCKYVEKNGEKFNLVLTGPGKINVPSNYSEQIIDIIMSKEELSDAYSAAFATCQPSINESFSFSIMESWLNSTPVLVHENCDVTREHCIQSNGGLYFNNYEEFESCIDYFLQNPQDRKSMGENGKNYVLNNFNWEKIVEKYTKFLTSLH